MKDIIKRIITEFWERKPTYITRKKVLPDLIRGKISLVIIGPRRAGKSYTIHEIKDNLFEHDIEGENYIYLNFEDERLADFSKEHFDLILDAYYEMKEKKPVLFLDEIQNIEGWNRFVRRLADNDYKVIVTGSNSEMLSRKIAEKLGGRFPEINIYPLNFKEFLKFKGIEFKERYLHSKQRFVIKKYFEEYLSYGGFPEVSLLSRSGSKMKVLRSYFNLVFYKDMIAKKKVHNEIALRFIIKKIRENIGKVATPRAIYASLKNAEIEVGPTTVENYVDYLEEAFLVVPCSQFVKSVIKQEKKKRYFIDNGYIKVFEIKEDLGLLLENLVFCEFLKKEKKVYFHQGKRECDFIVDKEKAIQVTYKLNEENKEREIEGILEAMEAYKIKNGIIITYEQEDEIVKDNKKIRVVPAWKWCLNQ